MRHHAAPIGRGATSRVRRSPLRSGFTLVELLVVIGIMLLLAGLTLAVVNTTAGTDRVRTTSRTVQAVLLGARDRAAQAKALRGVRLIPDPNSNHLVTAMQYLKPMTSEVIAAGTVQLERLDTSPADSMPDAPDIKLVRWSNADNTNAFLNASRIKFGSDTTWYPLNAASASSSNRTIELGVAFTQQPSDPMYIYPASVIAWPYANATYNSCTLEMNYQFLDNSQPVVLPSAAVIDLNRSGNCPTDWTTNRNAMDVMFSPRGPISGPLAAAGPIFFYVCDRKDADTNADPVVAKGEKMILAIFPQTGNVSTFPVDVTDSDNNSIADDPFLLAKKGAVAGR